MKKFLLILLVPLVVSAAAIAAPNPASPATHCKTLQKQFPALFGTGAQYRTFAACVTAKTAAAAKSTSNAAQACKTEQAADEKKFVETYAQDANGKSANAKAMGACVSAKSRASQAAAQSAELNAAKKCKLWRANASAFAAAHTSTPTSTFASLYGTKKNAFGKCVSAVAKTQNS